MTSGMRRQQSRMRAQLALGMELGMGMGTEMVQLGITQKIMVGMMQQAMLGMGMALGTRQGRNWQMQSSATAGKGMQQQT